jgi:hypothetical protein
MKCKSWIFFATEITENTEKKQKNLRNLRNLWFHFFLAAALGGAAYLCS